MVGAIGLYTEPAESAVGINKTLNYQGRLLTAGGAVVPDGNYNMRFKIYQDGPGNVAGNTGGTLMWTELWQNSVATGSSAGVVVKNGYFSVNLGSYCAFAGGSCQGNTNTGIDFNQDTLWLSMDVAGTAVSNTPTYDGELLPMRRLASSVYSLQAENANKLGGLTASQFIQNTTTLQTGASINIQASSTTNVTARFEAMASSSVGTVVVKQASSQTGWLLELQNSSSTRMAGFDSGGNVVSTGTVKSNDRNCASCNSSDLTVRSGDAAGTTSNSGNLIMDVGSATGTAGYITVGASNASSITLGKTTSNISTTIIGTTTIKPSTGNDSATALQVQNAAGNSVFNIDTTADANNLITNGSFENNTTGWSAKGGASIAASTTYSTFGAKSLAITTSATADDGVKYPITLTAGTTYSLAIYDRLDSGGFSTLAIGYSADGTTETTYVDSGNTVATNGWTRHLITFTPAAVSGSPYIFIKQTSSTARTFYVDGISLTAGSSANAFRQSKLTVDGVFTSPIVIQPTNGTQTALYVQDTSGASVLAVDSRNGRVGIGTTGPTSKLHVTTSTSIVGLKVNTTSTGDLLNLTNNDVNVMSVTSTGAALFKNSTNSTTAFQIQPSGSTTPVFNVDTTNSRVGIGNNAPGYALDVTGTAAASVSLLTPLLDTISASALTVGSTNATSINIGKTGSNIATTITGTTTIKPSTGNDSATAFQVQNATGNSLLNIDSTTDATNLITNGSFENNTTGWAAKGSATLASTTAQSLYGSKSLGITTTAVAQQGATFPITLTAGQTYSLSFYARLASGSFSTMAFGYSADGSTEATYVNSNETVNTSGWNRYTITFTPAAVSGSPYIFIKQTSATARTFYIDGAYLVSGSNTGVYKQSKLSFDGVITSPVILQGASDTMNALYVMDSTGTSALVVDTRNNRVGIGTTAPQAKLEVAGNSSSPSLRVTTSSTGDLLQLQNGSTTVTSVTNTGVALFKNSTNSTTAFQIQPSASTTPVFNVDTTNSRVGIGNNAPGYALDVTGTAAASTSLLTPLVDTASAAALTLGNTNATSINIGKTGSNIATTITGTTLIKPSTGNDSATAFRVQNAAGTALFTVDSTTGHLTLGQAGTLNSYLNFSNTSNSNVVSLGVQNGTSAYSLLLPSALGSAGDCLKDAAGNGTLSFGTCGSGSAGSLVQVPTTTAANTVTPTANSVVGMTINGTSGTAATALNVIQGGAAANVTLSNSGATSQSLLTVTHSSTTYTGKAIVVNMSSGSGTFTSGNFLELQTNGVNRFNINSSGAVTLRGGLGADITTAAGTSPNSIVIQPGEDTDVVGTGEILLLQAGNASGSTTSTGGLVTLKGGNATGGSQTGGGVLIDSGSGTTGGAINIGTSNAASVSIGKTSSNIATTVTGTAVFKPSSGNDSATAFQLQNASSVSLFNVDTTADSANLVTNGSFETNTTGWAAKGSATLSQTSAQATFGSKSLSIATTGDEQGARFPISLTASTTYTVSFYARLASGTFSNMSFGYSADGSTEATYVSAGHAPDTGGWQRFKLTFTPAAVSGSPYIFIKQSGSGTARTFYVDGVFLTASTFDGVFKQSKIAIDGAITSPLIVQPSSDTQTGLMVLDASHDPVFTVDTRSKRVGVGTSYPNAKLHVESASSSTPLFRGNVTSTGDLMSLTNNSSGILTITSTGATTLKQYTGNDSATAFQVQNASSVAQLVVDTVGSAVKVSGTIDTTTSTTLSLGTSTATGVTIGNAANTATTSVIANTTLNLGNNANNKTINIGATGTTNNTTAINIGNTTSTGGASTIQIGGTGATSGSNTGTTVAIQGGQTSIKAANAGATVQTYTDSATGFQVLNSGGGAVVNADTTTTNLVSNPSMDVNTTGWTTTGSGTGLAVARNTTASNAYDGSTSVQVTTASNSANTGASLTGFTASITPGNYVLRFQAKGGATNGNFSTLNVNIVGGGAPACLSAQTVATTGFRTYSCSFTSTSTNVTAINFVSSDAATQHIFYLDAVQLTTSANNLGTYRNSTLQLNGVISSPSVFQGSSDSTTAFQIQNSAGTTALFVADTVNGAVNIAGTETITSSSTTAFVIQNAANTRLAFDASGSILKVYDSSNSGVYASITASSTGATFAASSGTTTIGTGTGSVTSNLTGQNDVFSFTKTYTAAAGYSSNDFTIQRAITGGSNTLTGSVLKIEDISTATTASNIQPSVLLVNQSNASATGYLFNAQTNGVSRLTVANSGAVAIAGALTVGSVSSGTYDSSGALTVGASTATGITIGRSAITSAVVGTVQIGPDSSNHLAVSSSTGEPTLIGNARHSRKVTLSAEYAGASMTADGTNNAGTMTSDNMTSSPFRNFYKWVNTAGTAQDYDIWVRIPLPSDFSAFASGQTICIDTYASATTANGVAVTLYGTNNSSVTLSDADLTPSSTSTWQNQCTSSITGGTFAAEGVMNLAIKLTAPATTGDIRIGDITFNYLSKW